MSEFIYCLTRPGSEPLLKQEVKEFHPGWHFAFSRPGVVTFKAPRVLDSVENIPYLRFARRRGMSLGRGGEEEARSALAALEGESAQVYSREALTWAEGDRGDGTPEDFEARKRTLGAVGW